MTIPRTGGARAWLLILTAVAALGCGAAPAGERHQPGEPIAAAPGAPESSYPEAVTSSPAHDARYDLRADEHLGGHTIARHVGKSDAELRARLSRERRIAAASTYTDLETAERTVFLALRASQARVARWAARTGRRPNLALDYEGASGRVVGRSLRRGHPEPEPCEDAVVVLRWDERSDRYFVLTSYPEVRP